jgi:AcrR family transcriptional regulator
VDAPVDGRAARAQRTRRAIVDACIAMVEEGDLRPTAPRVAERAGVSVRSVFQHFDDLPTLHAAVTERVVERLTALVASIDPALPLDDRVRAFVANRVELLAAIDPFRRVAQVHGPFAPEIREAAAAGTRFLRRQVEQAFAPELGRLPAAERDRTLLALAAATSWSTWDVLRSELQAGEGEAAAALAHMLRALLVAADPATPATRTPVPAPALGVEPAR